MKVTFRETVTPGIRYEIQIWSGVTVLPAASLIPIVSAWLRTGNLLSVAGVSRAF
jgi:hypothetical protein